MNTTLSKEEINRNLHLFEGLLSCEHNLYHWIYGDDGRLQQTNCQKLVMNTFFERTGCHAYMLANCNGTDNRPLILSGSFGMLWCAVPEYSERSTRIHVIGPAKHAQLSDARIRTALRGEKKISLSWKEDLINMILDMPNIPSMQFVAYGLMLYYCIYEEKATRSDVRYQGQAEPAATDSVLESRPKPDRIGTYQVEQALLYCVREGDLNYKAVLAKAGTVSNGVRIDTGSSLGQALISTTTFTSLCVRAAIEGGMTPDMAYTIGDEYIQSMVNCRTISELGALNHTMFEDLIRRVHSLKSQSLYSKQIQACCDYIDLHIEDDLKLGDIASRFGYAEYYLSRKFKQEVGIPVSGYIRNARIEKAKMLLVCTNYPIGEIADRLHFTSGSYFGECFRKITGMLPQQYRNEHQKI